MATELQVTDQHSKAMELTRWLSELDLSQKTWAECQPIIRQLLAPITRSSSQSQSAAWGVLEIALSTMPSQASAAHCDIAVEVGLFWKPALSDSPAWAIEIAAHTAKREMKWRPTLHEFIQLVSVQVRQLSPWMPLRESEAKSAARLAANPPGTEAWRYDLGVGNDRPELVQRIYFAGKLSEAQLADWCNATHEWKSAELHPNFRAAIKSALAEPQRKAA